ncbi:MAG: NADH-quinone oxidoreductase subunit N [Phycisphaerales bacterium]
MHKTEIIEKVAGLWPEIVMLIGATACLFIGLSKGKGPRRSTPWIAALTLALAALVVCKRGDAGEQALALTGIAHYIKLAVAGVGLILLMVAAGVPNRLRQTLDAEAAREFEPGDVMTGEFYAFFLLSLTGVMLTAGAGDLVWLFLALELTSLPTYVMVATSRDRIEAQESAIKYFFLGALSAAIFLYGFALIYGATGSTEFAEITRIAQEQIAANNNNVPGLLLMGIVLSVVGVCFKIAAVPMHFYAADVYEGAATPVTAFLAFVPKTAGAVALILLLSLVGWPLPAPIASLIWLIAVLTMTVGNVLGLLQNNVKRVLAYSSVAHSGYILVGLLAGPAVNQAAGGALGDGIAAVLFYLVAYGLGTIASFAVLGCLRAGDREAQTYQHISGIHKKHPFLAALMLISVLSLVGLPPLVGFLGKVYLIGSAYGAGFIGLVIILVLNSAISAAYYLRIASACYFGEPDETVHSAGMFGRTAGALIAATLAIVLGVMGNGLVNASRNATAPAMQAAAPAPAPQVQFSTAK